MWARDNPEEVTPDSQTGRPDDMAGAAIFISSRAGDYLVGITIPVDGGVAFAN